jgi:hypothetical protein
VVTPTEDLSGAIRRVDELIRGFEKAMCPRLQRVEGDGLYVSQGRRGGGRHELESIAPLLCRAWMFLTKAARSAE